MSAGGVPDRGAPGGGDRTLLYVFLGCAGLGVLALSATAMIVFAGAWGIRTRGAQAIQSMAGLQVAAQEAHLEILLVADPERTQRVEAVYDRLAKKAQAGTLDATRIESLQRKIEEMTRDNVLSTDEADEILAGAEELARP